MNTKYAYIDEFGSFGFRLEMPDVASHFIICAIIIEEQDINEVERGLVEISKKFFQNSEIKSSKVKNNHVRRKKILDEMLNLPFHAYMFVADKSRIYENSGLRYKKSFYKFLNNFVYEELRINFRELVIVADEIGTDEFKNSFYEYARSKQKLIRTLFDEEFNESDLRLVNSQECVITQLADFVAGSLAYTYDVQKSQLSEGYRYERILSDKINRIKIFPDTIETYDFQSSSASSTYDPDIAQTCFRKAKAYVVNHKNIDDAEVKQRLIVLEYLLFRFMNNAMRKYIPTTELLDQLEYAGYERMSVHSFRNKIIAPLRDAEVVISSSKNGYKIPSTEMELCDFINHGKTIILPMLSRLKKCNDIISMGTNGRIRLFDKAEYGSLRDLLEDVDVQHGQLPIDE